MIRISYFHKMRTLLFILIALPTCFYSSNAQQLHDYSKYHKAIISVEELIIKENYRAALDQYEEIFDSYEFVFSRDYKIAVQLAVHIKDFNSAFKYLKLGITDGWTLKEIKRDRFLKSLTTMGGWDGIKNEYNSWRSGYISRINQDLKEVVKKMYKKDQKFAYKYLFKIGQKAKERYGNRRGVPHVRQQITKLYSILESKGYPGEKLIGESQWMTTVLTHHNSVSKEFVSNDTLYPSLRPKLLDAISRGEMDPYDLAMIEDWNIAVKSDRKDTGYGYLDMPSQEELSQCNELRRNLNIRLIETRNDLVNIQEKTGINFYLAGGPWAKGKIVPTNQ